MKTSTSVAEDWPRSASCRPDYRLSFLLLTRPPPNVKDALVLSFVALTETLAMGKALAERASQKLDTSQEILAVGAANVAGAAFQSYTVAGSFSRSAVNVVTGGSSQLSSIVTAGAVVLTLLFFTGCFERVPKAVLGSILIYAVSGFVDVKRVKALASSDKKDWRSGSSSSGS